jgi:outer membrane assembly lipoprotein YfiO
MKKIICFLILIILLNSGTSYGFWIWSKETKKWINPVYQIFETPQEQFDWAKGYFDEQDYRKAIFEFRKILKKFPTSELAPEAKFYIATSLDKLNKWYKAYEEYQSILDNYPLNQRLEEIVEKQYLIGEKYFKRKKYYHAKDIFQKVLANAPYSKVSDVAKFKVGLCDLRMKEYADARDQFEELVDNYGFSPYVDDASYHIALCSFKLSSLVKDYDDELIDQAVEDIEYFLRRYPTSEFVPDAQSLLSKLQYKKAEKLFLIGQFYEKQKKYYAAKKYYEDVVYTYSDTVWGKKANNRLKGIEKRTIN